MSTRQVSSRARPIGGPGYCIRVLPGDDRWELILIRQSQTIGGRAVADSGLFVGFGQPVRGRERQATKVFGETVEYYSRLQQQGEIESFEPVLLEAHGGELGGFFLLRGEQDKLARVRGSEEFARLTLRAQLIADNIGIVGAVLGERLGAEMATYEQQLGDLT